MEFENYSPRDRRLCGRTHLASWLILMVLAGLLAIALPLATSGTPTVGQLAAATPHVCQGQGCKHRI